jgi:phosphatidylethanolamine/phosphatidyl-N-methylethanolamine N-methyltransferase
MPSVHQAGRALFLKRWLRRPLAIGAVVPSGRLLAEAMAQATMSNLADRDGYVVELGAGTGEVTRALLTKGIAGDRLVLVERDPELARFLRRRFAGPQTIEGDASCLPRLLADHAVAPLGAVVSSLPLLSLPADVVKEIVTGVFDVLPPGGAMVQFTYGPKPPIPADLRRRLGLDGRHGARIWRNMPPAMVWSFRRLPAA